MKRDLVLKRDVAERLTQMDRLLAATYRTPESALRNKSDPLDEAIYIILTFQTDIPRAKETWGRLRNKYRTWSAVEKAPRGELERVLRPGGLQKQKAASIKALLREVRRLNGSLSLDFLHRLSTEEAERILLRLPGLSWKGARCVLLYSLRRHSFPVDVNTFRILKRIGILRLTAVYRRKSLHDELQNAVRGPRRKSLHINLVIHGQRTCLPRSPKCSVCPIRSICGSYSGLPKQRSFSRSAV